MNLQPFLKLRRRSDLPLKASSSSNDTNCIESYGLSCLEQAFKCKVCGKETKWQTWLTTLKLTTSRECKFCNQVYSSRSCTKVDIIHRISSLALTKCPTLILCPITCVCNHKHIRSWAKDWWSITSWWFFMARSSANLLQIATVRATIRTHVRPNCC